MDFNLLYPHLPDVSKHGHEVDRLINVIHGFMLVLFVGWAIFFVYCLVRFRARPGHTSQYELPHAKPSKWAEGFVILFEVVLLLGFSVPVWGRIKNDFPTPDQSPLEVRVIAQQFAWNFHYAGADGKFGKNDPKRGRAAAGDPIGLDRSGDGADDVVSAEFHFPVNRPVIARLTSVDVIHGFHMPLMRVQHDVMPGMEVKIWFEAKEIPHKDAGPDERGRTEIICAQLCGNSHFKMRGAVKIETADEFEKWLATAVPQEFEEEE